MEFLLGRVFVASVPILSCQHRGRGRKKGR